ncbi:diguanylate cyclase [Dokdonella sp.]|uniref:diguanylate cyclase n=1 Tax=Dokdonella sp. TaxID=2291710 RepID=UPI0031BC27D3|nr:GGDEF domain-containing protein [Dokdonella sp.]
MSSGDRDYITTQRRTFRPANDFGNGAGLPACLVVLQGQRLGQRIDVGVTPLVVGRAPECDFQVVDRSVSRQHAQIWKGLFGYRIKDLGSTNKTLLNEQPIIEAELKDGDQVTIGNCVLKFMERSSVEARYHEEIYQLATIDPLTGLYNRRHFLELLERELARSAGHGRPLALLIIDLDHFKQVNDRFGHPAGDLVLKQVAATLRGDACDDCIVARIGGEEFAVVLAERTLAQALAFAEALCRKVAAMPLPPEAGTDRVTVSIGVAALRAATGSVGELMRAADAQLYRAKAEGRNRALAED